MALLALVFVNGLLTKLVHLTVQKSKMKSRSRVTMSTVLLFFVALLSITAATNSGGGGGGLRRKRTKKEPQSQQQQLQHHSSFTNDDGGSVEQDLASQFFLTSKAQAELEEIDMRELLRGFSEFAAARSMSAFHLASSRAKGKDKGKDSKSGKTGGSISMKVFLDEFAEKFTYMDDKH